MSDNWTMVSSYTREQALADGVLHDVSAESRRFGFKIPVAVTDTVWRGYVEATPELVEYGQSTAARLDDVLAVLFFTIKAMPKDADNSRMTFQVKFLMDTNETYEEPELIAHIGPGDTWEPVLTIMLPEDE